MSSRKVITYLRFGPENTEFIKHWKVGGPLVTPNGMMRNSKWPWCVLKAVFSSSPLRMRI